MDEEIPGRLLPTPPLKTQTTSMSVPKKNKGGEKKNRNTSIPELAKKLSK